MESSVCGFRQKQRGVPDRDSLFPCIPRCKQTYFHARSVSVRSIKKEKASSGIPCDRRKDRNRRIFTDERPEIHSSDRTSWEMDFHLKRQKERKYF